MKKIIIGSIMMLTTALLVGCGKNNHNGTFVATVKSEYSISEDTIELKDDLIINYVGFRRLVNGNLKKKEFRVKSWKINSPEAPIIEFANYGIIIGRVKYLQIK